MTEPITRWGLEWRMRNRLDGERQYLICREGIPTLFRTRRVARAYANQRYGYIKRRRDLRQEPYGLRMPRPVRLVIQVQP